MRKVNEVINYGFNLAKDIKATGSSSGLDKTILSYVQEDEVPYAAMRNKEQKILKDLEKVSDNFGRNIANELRGYLEEHPISTGDSNLGGHVGISQAEINNGFVFMLGLVVTTLNQIA